MFSTFLIINFCHLSGFNKKSKYYCEKIKKYYYPKSIRFNESILISHFLLFRIKYYNFQIVFYHNIFFDTYKSILIIYFKNSRIIRYFFVNKKIYCYIFNVC